MLDRVVGLGAALFIAGCPSEPFGCENDDQCQVDAAAGQCELNGYCSFPDPDCPSGRRYSNLAGGGLGGLCVNAPEETTGMGTSTGPSTTSSSPMTGLTTALTTGPGDSSSGAPGEGSSSSGSTSTSSGDESSGTTGGPGLDEGLVVHVDFDSIITDDEGTVPTPIGTLPAACDLVLDACPAFVDEGVSGRAGRFDGVDDVIAIADDDRLHLEDWFTLALWARRTGPFEPYALLAGKAYGAGEANCYELYLRDPDEEPMDHRAVFGTDTPVVSANASQTVSVEWTHYAGVREGGLWQLYIDGLLASVEPIDGEIIYDDQAFTIGADFGFGELDNFFTGDIDEVRLYDRALSPEQVMELATAR